MAVDGEWYGPDYPGAEVTEAVANGVTNPSAWSEDEPAQASAPEPDPPKPPRKTARKR